MKSKKSSKIILIIAIILFIITSIGTFFVFKVIFDSSPKKDTKEYKKETSSVADIKNGGVEVVFTPANKGTKISDSDMDAVKSLLEMRLVMQNITDYEIRCDTKNQQISVTFPWNESDEAFSYEKATDIIDYLKTSSTLVFRKGNGDENGEVILQGAEDIKFAYADIDAYGQYIVSLKLTEQGAQKFEQATSELIGQYISIYLDTTVIVEETGVETVSKVLLSAPMVQDVISGGECYISGADLTSETAIELANQINSGKLPFMLTVDESKTKITSPY